MHTFAISLQLLPASLICLSLSSSAGVQGVFVRLFFIFGSSVEASTWAGCTGCTGCTGAALLFASAPPAASAMLLACWLKMTDLRFRLPEEGDCAGCALIETSLFSWTGGAAGCESGFSVAAVCCGGWI